MYSRYDAEGDYKSGDARVAAYRLLANNPEAAQMVAEKKGEDGRRLLFDGIEEDGPVGEAAGAALESRLHDLTRKASVDTLEVVIKMVNAEEIGLKGPGKASLARLLSHPPIVDTLATALSESEAGDHGRRSQAEGFGVKAATLEGAFGKILEVVPGVVEVDVAVLRLVSAVRQARGSHSNR